MDSLFSDFDSFSECSSTVDHDDIESLYGECASSILFNLEESIKKIDDFLSFERGFVHGDIVRLISDPLGQMGKVVNVDMVVDVETTCGQNIRSVSSGSLEKIRSVLVGDYVVCRGWLGKVKKVVDRVLIQFDNGRKIQLTAGGPEKIISISPDLTEDPQYPFYPGQRVQVELSSVSTPIPWPWGSQECEWENGTVCNIDAGLVYVDWLGYAVLDGDIEPSPPGLQDSKNISVLRCFLDANWQLGDWCVLPMENSFQSASAFELAKEREQSEIIIQSNNINPNFHSVGMIVKTKTKVDVQWQDGGQSLQLDPHTLIHANFVHPHDFWPNVFVLEKGENSDSQVLVSQKWGVVKCVDSKEQTVTVNWWKSSPNLLDPDELTEEVVSAYELVEHPDYSYRLGEAVLKVNQTAVDLSGGICIQNRAITEICRSEEANVKAVENGGDHGGNLKGKFLSNIGIIIGFENGRVEVQWASGSTSKVAPYEIFGIDNCEDTGDPSTLSGENTHLSDDILVEENLLLGENVKDISGPHHGQTKESCSLPLSKVLGFFQSITSKLFWPVFTMLVNPSTSTSEDAQVAGKLQENEVLELHNSKPGGKPSVDDLPENQNPELLKVAHENILPLTPGVRPELFRQFDFVMDCSDHHFVGMSTIGQQSPQVKRGWLKRVHQEWSILEKDLPETIYVRVYEDRMDLLRASIVGAAGTPYHDGLFFFDIHLPPQYPKEPPLVYYHSWGLCINPNLYETGTVCLSLLNTWTGSNYEVWHPESSTILQVLLSLQGLVLNEKPYFNEAGFASQIGKAEGENNSIRYNENVFLVSCRSVLCLLRKPPKHFEALVDAHFSLHCRDILLSCKAYMQGAPIGYPINSSENAEQENMKGSSRGFKIMLRKLFPKLIQSFSEKGFDCTDLSDKFP